VNYPLRGAVTFKSTVGTNVASDALANLASGGVTGGALIIIGEDYGEGSSIMQERVHAFAMKSQMWLLDPRPNLPSIVRAVETGFELSEASNTPVMLELRIRACHVSGHFTARGNKRPDFTLADALENPRRDLGRIAMPPMTYVHEKDKWEQRWPAAVKFIEQRGLNEFFDSEASDIGIVVQGGLYNTTIRGLQLLGLADSFGGAKVPLYVLNVTYPLVDTEFVRFCAGKKAMLMVEEGQPDYLEQAVNTILRRADIQTMVHGKDMLSYGRRVYRRRGTSGRAEVHRALSARLGGACSARGRSGAARAAAVERARRRGGQGARPAALVLHRLSGAADLRRDEARRARSRSASRQR
jgi:indolepyruvate ferredoxin oxidoreductase, alpha subunit